ncbi:hypothetical protein ARMGADRAFT_1088585 [Armillaria gallica]|uniref:Uncharacterized protein n=1 Tax=Armillaria gallica TaxID=47427 RepID=A0A2H3D9H4_ARMGA|nr:hypothetical protein ARMGADRAFT_1088585 [Armillaria gallica]
MKTDEVHVDVQGNVVFPNLDWASVSLREVQTHLAAFFNAQWASVNEGQIPWDDVIMNQSKYIKTPLPSAMQLKKASELEFGDTITTSPLPVPLSPSKPLAPSPKKATSAKPSPSKSKSPNRHLASPRNGGSPATGHEGIDWLKRMRPQRDPTPDPTIADLGKNPTKTPNKEVVPPIAEEPIIVEKPIIVERLATPLGEGICPPPESPLSPVPQEISDVPPVKPPVKVTAKVKRARGRPKKVTEAGTETAKDAEESKKRKSPVSSHPKEPVTKRIKPNAELPIPPRRSTRREEMAKPKEPSKTVNYTQCKGARGWYIVWPQFLIFIAIDFILPKLYINSLLAMFNYRPEHLESNKSNAERAGHSTPAVLCITPQTFDGSNAETNVSIPLSDIPDIRFFEDRLDHSKGTLDYNQV